MKKLIFILLLLVTVNLNAVVVVAHSNRDLPVDNSLQTSLTRKDYCFHCEKCNKDFVIHNMLYHMNTDMYFYYKQSRGLVVLQPYEGRKLCDECMYFHFKQIGEFNNKQFFTVLGFFLIIMLLGCFIVYYFNRE